MCGKSMLGSLYLSILLISCISFDFGSANSSGEEIEEIVPIRPTPLECCKNAGVPEFCLGLCIPADAMARQRNRFNACAKYDAIIDGCYDQIQETSDDKDGPTIYHGSPAIVRTQSKRQEPQRGIEIPKQGYIFKENYCCGVGVGQFIGLNLEEALNGCNADSQCKCVDYERTGDKKYYAWPTLDLPGPLAGTDAWIKDN